MSEFAVVIGGGDGRGDCCDEFSLRNRLLQNSEGPGLGGIVAKLCRVVGGDQNARGDDVNFFQLPQSFQASQTVHVHVEQGQMNFLMSRQLECFFTRLGFEQPKERLEDLAERSTKCVVVVSDQKLVLFENHELLPGISKDSRLLLAEPIHYGLTESPTLVNRNRRFHSLF